MALIAVGVAFFLDDLLVSAMGVTFVGAAMTALGSFQGIQVAVRRAHAGVAEEREDRPKDL